MRAARASAENDSAAPPPHQNAVQGLPVKGSQPFLTLSLNHPGENLEIVHRLRLHHDPDWPAPVLPPQLQTAGQTANAQVSAMTARMLVASAGVNFFR
jgi:hypothetical protein